MNQKQRVQKALEQCFGQVHDTPVGKMCMFGRIDRAYTMGAPAAVIKGLEKQLSEYLAAYRQALAGYDGNENSVTQCKCEYCTRMPTFNGVKEKVTNG